MPSDTVPAWSVPTDRPGTVAEAGRASADESGHPEGPHGPGRRSAGHQAGPESPYGTGQPSGTGEAGRPSGTVPAAAGPSRPGPAAGTQGPFRPHRTDKRPDGPVAPSGGRHAAPDGDDSRPDPGDRQAAVEARILLPVRKDR